MIGKVSLLSNFDDQGMLITKAYPITPVKKDIQDHRIRGQSYGFQGRKHSEETKRKLRDARARQAAEKEKERKVEKENS